MTPGPASDAAGGSGYRSATVLAALAWLVMALQELLLFLRPTPYGGPYVRDWAGYFGRALFYNSLGVAAVSLPFLLYWLWRYRRPAGEPARRRWLTAQLAVLTLTVGLDHADNEVMRFLGTHLTLTLLRTYERVGAWGADMIHVFTTDRGGPGLPFVVLFGGMGLTWFLGRRAMRRTPAPWPLGAALTAGIVPLIVPLVGYNLPGGHFPRNRVRPEVVTLALELARDSRAEAAPADLHALADEYHRSWLAATADTGWSFDSSLAYPLFRRPATITAPDSGGWNVIYLQLETFRGWDVGFLRPDRHPSATPFLDSLAADPASAYWTRFLSFGPPTINGFMAGHCSISPHSAHNVSTTYTGSGLDCLPAVLRRHGWHTAYFTGSDPDWDNQTIWLRRWYDEHAYYADADERDREVFRRAAERIRALGRAGQPFFATVVSISNHYPFRSREPALDLTRATEPDSAVLNTMHYTDDVVREFVTGLEREPWFGHTLLVLVGDHGYNLGEHDGTPGQRNGWRESVWVPLLIHGPHPALPRGPQPALSSQLDLAPTITDLLGIRESTPWLGRSLVRPAGPGTEVTMVRGEVLLAETARWSLTLDPASGAPRLYDAADPLQRHDLAAEHPDEAARLIRLARGRQRLVDYLIEADRIWPRGAP